MSMRREAIRLTDLPDRGTLATISSADKTFECHIFLGQVRTSLLLLER